MPQITLVYENQILRIPLERFSNCEENYLHETFIQYSAKLN